MAIVFLTGFEHGFAVNASGGGLHDAVTAAGLIAGAARTGLKGYRVDAAGSTYFWRKNFSPTKSVVAGRIHFKVNTLPAGGTVGAVVSGLMASPASGWWYITIDSTGVLKASIRSSTNVLQGSESTGPTVTADGLFHCLEFLLRFDTNPNTIAFRVDSAADVTGASFAQAATTTSNFQIGQWNTTASAGTYQIDFDDLILGDASTDYPFGPGHTIGIQLGSDGTHSMTANDLRKGDAGTNLTNATTDAYSTLLTLPFTNTRSATAGLQQAVIRTTSYAEVAPATGVAQAGSANAIYAELGYACQTGTSADTGACIVRNSAGTATVLFGDLPVGQGGNGGALADYSESSVFHKGVIVTKPAGGWTSTEVEAMRVRMGGSDDVTPAPQWHHMLFEVDYPDSVVTATLPPDPQIVSVAVKTASTW